jgi:hypothetical protein
VRRARKQIPGSRTNIQRLEFEQVRLVFRTTFQRQPSAAKLKLAEQFLASEATPAKPAETAPIAIGQGAKPEAKLRKMAATGGEKFTPLNALERHTQIVLLTNELIFVNRSQRNAGNPARSSAQFGRIKIMPANDHRSRVDHATLMLFPATRREHFAAREQTRNIINLCGRRSFADSAPCPSSFPEIPPHSSSRLCAFA